MIIATYVYAVCDEYNAAPFAYFATRESAEAYAELWYGYVQTLMVHQ